MPKVAIVVHKVFVTIPAEWAILTFIRVYQKVLLFWLFTFSNHPPHHTWQTSTSPWTSDLLSGKLVLIRFGKFSKNVMMDGTKNVSTKNKYSQPRRHVSYPLKRTRIVFRDCPRKYRWTNIIYDIRLYEFYVISLANREFLWVIIAILNTPKIFSFVFDIITFPSRQYRQE